MSASNQNFTPDQIRTILYTRKFINEDKKMQLYII